MKNTNNKEIAMEDVKNASEADPAFKSVLKYCAGVGADQPLTPLNDLHKAMNAAGCLVPRSGLIRALKRLDALGCGKFRTGRRKHVTRFYWWVSMQELGKSVVVDTETAPKSERDVQLLPHKYRLRPEMELVIDLPTDLTEKEALRLADFVRTLSFGADGLAA